MKAKNFLIVGIILVAISGLALLYFLIQTDIYYTPTFKERSDFNPKEIKMIEEGFDFELSDGARIVNSRFTQARGTSYLVWIEGIKDKDDFIKRNSLVFQHNSHFDVLYDDNDEMQDAERYTTSKDEDIEWYLCKNGGTWSAFVDTPHVKQPVWELFDNVPNQAPRNFS